MTTEAPAPIGLKMHRRSTWRRITRPLLLVFLLILLPVVITALLPQAGQRGLVANALFTLLLLCPLAIILLLIFVIMLALNYGTARAHDGLAQALSRVEIATSPLPNRVNRALQPLARISIGINARAAWLDKVLFSIYDRPQANAQTKDPASDQSDPNHP